MQLWIPESGLGVFLISKKKKAVRADEQGTAQYEAASQWQLMCWKFKKHKMAMISLPLLVALYIVAFLCEFFSPYGTLDRFTEYKFAPPTKLHFVDEAGKFSPMPFFYDTVNEVNPATYVREYVENTAQKHYIKFFVKGNSYKLLGFIPANVHLFGTDDPDVPFFVMGTDRLGRDLFSRTIYGARISLSFGLISIFFTFIIGITLGGLSGYLGGIVDTIIQRLIDLLLCMPHIPLWMALAAALPRDWAPLKIYFGMVIIMSLIGWTGLARVVRGKVLSLREEDYAMAARLNNASHLRVIFRHLIPSFFSYIIVNLTLSIPGSILGETALSYLGLGLQAPVVSWGVLLQDAQNIETLAFHAWLMWPAAFVVFSVLLFNFVGDGFRDAADPYK